MMHEPPMVNTTQVQQQKTTIKGSAIQGDSAVKLVWTGIFMLGVVAFILYLCWQQNGLWGKTFDSLLGLLIVAIGLWLLWNIAKREHYKTKRLEFSTHFYAHGESIIGDGTTRTYRMFHPALQEQIEPKDEIVDDIPYQPDTWEQQGDRHIWEMKEREGKTWNEIVGSFDVQLGVTVQKCRTAYNRHQGRLTRGETYR